tara:strand:+ start:59 stop:268 length:210 start_codon:yes stop_codon:yes gene_type:complete
MRLTYWHSRCPDDSSVYSIRTKTKREALAQIEARGGSSWEAPVKVTLDYLDAFDLMAECSHEDHHYWEN